MNQKYILGIATFTWGYQAEFLWFAIPMAMILEARNFTRNLPCYRYPKASPK
jgi:hypothetical protein